MYTQSDARICQEQANSERKTAFEQKWMTEQASAQYATWLCCICIVYSVFKAAFHFVCSTCTLVVCCVCRLISEVLADALPRLSLDVIGIVSNYTFQPKGPSLSDEIATWGWMSQFEETNKRIDQIDSRSMRALRGLCVFVVFCACFSSVVCFAYRFFCVLWLCCLETEFYHFVACV